jgi:ribosomal protein S12 methylthiotransferase accessory factor
MKIEAIFTDKFNDLIPTNIIQKISGDKIGIIRGFYQILNEKDDPEFFNITTTHTNLERILDTNFEIEFRAGGSGMSLKEALMRAIGEVIERYSISFYDERDLIFASFNDLEKKGLNAIDPQNLPLFSSYQYSTPGFPFEKFERNTKVAWIEGFNLTTKSPILVPAQLIIGVYKYLKGEKRIGYSTTSGCAAALSKEEAILKGIYEQIERDAIMITWYTKYTPPKIELKNTYISRKLKNKKIKYYILDISLDHRIPVIMAISIDTTKRGITFTCGFSSNLNIQNAIYKALLEVSQGRVYIKRSVATTPYSLIDPSRITDFDGNLRFYANRINLKYLKFLINSSQVVREDDIKNKFAFSSTNDIKRDLKILLNLIFKKGYNLIIFDLTTDDIRDLGFNVIRVFIPELVQLGVPAYPFLGNRRLYLVPKKLGYSNRVLSEKELNKMPHPVP